MFFCKKKLSKGYLKIKILRLLGYKISIGKNVFIGKNFELNISKSAKLSIGDGCHIGNNCRLIILGEAIIKNHFSVRDNCYFYVLGKLSIGNSCSINDNIHIGCRGEITINDNVAIGPNVIIYDHDHILEVNKETDWDKYKIGKIVIGCDCWIASNVCILRDSEIGKKSILGCGVVLKQKIKEKSKVVNENRLIIKGME